MLLLGQRCVRNKISKLLINGWRQPKDSLHPEIRGPLHVEPCFQGLGVSTWSLWFKMLAPNRTFERERPAWHPHPLLESRMTFLTVCRKAGCLFFHNSCLFLHSAVRTLSCSSVKTFWYLLNFQNSLMSSFSLIMFSWVTEAHGKPWHKHVVWSRVSLTTAACRSGLFLLKCFILQGAGDHVTWEGHDAFSVFYLSPHIFS